MSQIAARYARALADTLGDSPARLRTAAAELTALAAAVQADVSLKNFLASPALPATEKAAAFLALEKCITPEVARVVALLITSGGKSFSLKHLADDFARQVTARGAAATVVETAAPLSAEQEKELTGMLIDKTGHAVELEARINPALIAGLRITLGDTVYDLSLTRQLARLGKVLAA